MIVYEFIISGIIIYLSYYFLIFVRNKSGLRCEKDKRKRRSPLGVVWWVLGVVAWILYFACLSNFYLLISLFPVFNISHVWSVGVICIFLSYFIDETDGTVLVNDCMFSICWSLCSLAKALSMKKITVDVIINVLNILMCEIYVLKRRSVMSCIHNYAECTPITNTWKISYDNK